MAPTQVTATRPALFAATLVAALLLNAAAARPALKSASRVVTGQSVSFVAYSKANGAFGYFFADHDIADSWHWFHNGRYRGSFHVMDVNDWHITLEDGRSEIELNLHTDRIKINTNGVKNLGPITITDKE